MTQTLPLVNILQVNTKDKQAPVFIKVEFVFRIRQRRFAEQAVTRLKLPFEFNY
jgi:hypothetical protein